MDSMESRLAELETRLAFQDQTVESLNATVADQARRLDALQAEVAALKSYVHALLPLLQETDTQDTPPHY